MQDSLQRQLTRLSVGTLLPRPCAGATLNALQPQGKTGEIFSSSAGPQYKDSCLSQNSSEVSWDIPAGYTALTGIEQPLAPSTKLRKFSYISNFQSTGDVPAFLGGLASLEKLDLSTNNFNGSIPGEAQCGAHISVCGFGGSGKAQSCTGSLPCPILSPLQQCQSARRVRIDAERLCYLTALMSAFGDPKGAWIPASHSTLVCAVTLVLVPEERLPCMQGAWGT